MVDVEIKPNHIVCTTKKDASTGAATSFQIECSSDGGAVIYNWDDADCGATTSANPTDNYVLAAQQCIEQDLADGTTAYVSSLCVPTFAAAPTTPPAPAPTVAAIEGWFVEETFGDSGCTAELIDKRETWSAGLCRRDEDHYIGLLRFVIDHVAPGDDSTTVTQTKYYYEDENCAFYRGESDTSVIQDLGSCRDGGDGTYFLRTYSAGATMPSSPFGQGATHTDYCKSTCAPGSELHMLFEPINQCVNQTASFVDDQYYYGLTAGSKILTCGDAAVDTTSFATVGCAGAPIKTSHAPSDPIGTCVLVKGDGVTVPDLWTTVTCTGGSAPSESPSATGTFSTTISIQATQVGKMALLPFLFPHFPPPLFYSPSLTPASPPPSLNI